MRRWMIFVVLLSLPFAARAESPDWRIEVGGGGEWFTDRSYDLVSGTDVAGVFGLAAGWQPGWADNRLSLRLGYRVVGQEGRLFSAWTSTFTLATFDAGARYDLLAAGRTRLFARGALFVDYAQLELSAASGPDLSDSSFVPGATAALGGEWSLSSPTSTSTLRFSLLAEAGWSQRFTQARFDELSADVDEGTEPAPIASLPVNVGDVALSGPFFHLAAVVRF